LHPNWHQRNHEAVLLEQHLCVTLGLENISPRSRVPLRCAWPHANGSLLDPVGTVLLATQQMGHRMCHD
ncbi:MAG: hypothetical protein ACK55Z_31450, partial [bacterium]